MGPGGARGMGAAERGPGRGGADSGHHRRHAAAAARPVRGADGGLAAAVPRPAGGRRAPARDAAGHAYLLARGPLPESGFVYLMVTKAQSDQLQGLKPLDELTATVTVRAARTRYLATPVVELVRVGSGR